MAVYHKRSKFPSDPMPGGGRGRGSAATGHGIAESFWRPRTLPHHAGACARARCAAVASFCFETKTLYGGGQPIFKFYMLSRVQRGVEISIVMSPLRNSFLATAKLVPRAWDYHRGSADTEKCAAVLFYTQMPAGAIPCPQGSKVKSSPKFRFVRFATLKQCEYCMVPCRWRS